MMPYSIPRTILDASSQVFARRVNGRTVYVKKRRRNKNPVGWLAQRLLYRLTDNLLVVPPSRPIGDNVEFEAGVLRRLAGQGVPVPDVLHVEADYFVMSDVGRTLEAVLRDEPEAAARHIAKAVRELRRLHDKGFAHGASQIKNLTVKDGEIHFIDFEENIPDAYLKKFQMRDLFLFLMSLERHGHDPDLQALCRLYDGDTGESSLAEIRSALLRLRVVRLLDNRIFSRFSMRDIRSLNRLIRKAEGVADFPAATADMDMELRNS